MNEHTHLWSGVGPEAYCIGCLEPRDPIAAVQAQKRRELKALLQIQSKALRGAFNGRASE